MIWFGDCCHWSLLLILSLAANVNSQAGGLFDADRDDDDESANDHLLMEFNRKASCTQAEQLLSKFAIELDNHSKDLPAALVELLQLCLVKKLQTANAETLMNSPLVGDLYTEVNRILPNETALFALQRPPFINETVQVRIAGFDISQIHLAWKDEGMDWSQLESPWDTVAAKSVVFAKDFVLLDKFFWMPRPRTSLLAPDSIMPRYTHVIVGNGRSFEEPSSSDFGVLGVLNYQSLGADCEYQVEAQMEIYSCKVDLRFQLDSGDGSGDCSELTFIENVANDHLLNGILSTPAEVHVKPASWRLAGKPEIRPALDERSCPLIALRFRLSRAAGFSNNDLGRLPIAIATVLGLASPFVATRMMHSLLLKLLAFALALFGHVTNTAFALMGHGHHSDSTSISFLLVWIFATALIDLVASRVAFALRRTIRRVPPPQWLVFGNDVIHHYAGFLPMSLTTAGGVGGKDQRDAENGVLAGEAEGGAGGGANQAWLRAISAIYGVLVAVYTGVYGVVLILLYR